MSIRQNHLNTKLVFDLPWPGLHKTFRTYRGRSYTDTQFFIFPGILKSSQPIGDDTNMCMALSLTCNFVRYSYMCIYIYTHVFEYELPPKRSM